MATATQGISVRLVNDPSPESPRMWDNLGTMVCAHRRYNLGDESGRSDALSIIREHLPDKQLREMDFDESHVPDIERALEVTGQVVMLPLYLYQHSGMAMKTSPFSCQWDSGKVGFIFVSKAKLTQEYGWKRITADRRNKIHTLLEGEVEDYDTYLRGDVWGFEVVQESQVVDSWLMNPEGHFDFVHREMRWTSTEAERTKDGIDIRTLGLGHSLQAALNVIRDEEVIRTVGKFGGGKALGMLAVRTVSTASAICMISVPGFSLENFFNGGRAVERFWLEATRLGLAVHPLISPLYFFARYLHGGEGLDSKEIQDLQLLREQFQTVTGADDEDSEVFLVKIAVAPEPEIKSYRLPLEEILVIE